MHLKCKAWVNVLSYFLLIFLSFVLIFTLKTQKQFLLLIYSQNLQKKHWQSSSCGIVFAERWNKLCKSECLDVCCHVISVSDLVCLSSLCFLYRSEVTAAGFSLSLCFLFSVRCVSAAAARHSLGCWQKVGGWKDAVFLSSSRQTWSLSEQLWAPCSCSLCSQPVSF